jgi:hypothetical protein
MNGLDPTLPQIWSWRRRSFVQGQAGAGTIVVAGMDAKHAMRLCLAEDAETTQALSSKRPDQALTPAFTFGRRWRPLRVICGPKATLLKRSTIGCEAVVECRLFSYTRSR